MLQENTRTSVTHPLKIQWVNIGENSKIGLTFCPGKKGPSIYGFLWDRDLEIDLKIIKDSASLLLTLMEDHELTMLNVRELGMKAKEMSLEWLHLHLPDVSTPDADFMTNWPKHSLYIRKLIAKNENVQQFQI